MKQFSGNIGELVFETLLNSKIKSITDLNLGNNSEWFKHPNTTEEISSNVGLLVELISKQAGLQNISIGSNKFTSNATKTIMTGIADYPGTSRTL